MPRARAGVGCGAQGAACPGCSQSGQHELTFAVLGDYPYNATQLQQLPQVVAQINADRRVSLVFHVGDIMHKNRCTTSYYHTVKSAFDQFTALGVHVRGPRVGRLLLEKGGYDPLNRLPENVTFVDGDVSFGVFHLVGEENGLKPWAGQTAVIAEQQADADRRVAGADTVISRAFEAARGNHSRAVVLLTHGDMFAGSAPARATKAYSAVVRRLAREASAFDGPVLLINGDSHSYVEDKPLDRGSPWLSAYGVRPAGNLTRITVDGDTNATDYVRVTAEPYYVPVLKWTQVPFNRH